MAVAPVDLRARIGVPNVDFEAQLHADDLSITKPITTPAGDVLRVIQTRDGEVVVLPIRLAPGSPPFARITSTPATAPAGGGAAELPSVTDILDFGKKVATAVGDVLGGHGGHGGNQTGGGCTVNVGNITVTGGKAPVNVTVEIKASGGAAAGHDGGGTGAGHP